MKIAHRITFIEIKFSTAKASSHQSCGASGRNLLLAAFHQNILGFEKIVLNNSKGVTKHLSWIDQLTIWNRKYFDVLNGLIWKHCNWISRVGFEKFNGKTDKVSRKTKQKQVKGTKTNLKIFRLLLSVSVWQYESKNVLENNKIRP